MLAPERRRGRSGDQRSHGGPPDPIPPPPAVRGYLTARETVSSRPRFAGRAPLAGHRTARDVEHLARADELHARAVLGRAERALVLVDRPPAVPGDEARAALGQPLLVERA